MVVELINTGSELMLGRVLNTHQQWICRHMADAGYPVSRQVSIADTADEIAGAVRESLSRADLVITTGGLGPTSDDLTRDVIAGLVGRPLREDPAVLEAIRERFARHHRPLPEKCRVEAQVPEGAVVLPNFHGTAPGLAMEIPPGRLRTGEKPSWLILLPGPPRELHPMFLESALPLIQRVLPSSGAFVCRTFRTVGIGESSVQERIEGHLQDLVKAGLEIGYCARPGQVDVRFAAQGTTAAATVDSARVILQREFGECCFAEGDAAIEEVVVRLLAEQKATLALAESCTGGLIADRITNVPGASAVFVGGLVVYSNDMKREFAGVKSETLERHGAVSEPVALELAAGTRLRTGADYAVAVTGIAGPGGGSEEKPVGTVFIALATPTETRAWRFLNRWDRRTFKEVTSQQALNLLRIALAKKEPSKR